MKSFLKGILFFFIVACLAIVTGYVTFSILSTTKNYEVPFLTGKSLLEANKILSNMNLSLKIDGEAYDADIPAGNILKQNIPAGSTIKAGRRIGIIISKGPKILYTPVMSGLLIDDAEEIAHQSNIKINRIIKVHSAHAEKNHVIAQDPNPEEHGVGGISLIVSIGPYDELMICPDFTDMNIDKARNLARELGLDITTTGNGNKVSAQSPSSRSLVKKGALIKLELKEDKGYKWWL